MVMSSLRSCHRPRKMKQSEFPAGWDEERVRRVLAHYEQQTEEEAVAEDETASLQELDAIAETIEGEFDAADNLRRIREERVERL